MPKVKLEIDGVKLEATAGTMIIEVADQAGISIPRFCYHKKLSVAANCRMCLVDVTNIPKPVPACATPVADGMVVLTESEKAIDAQRSVMEFLLINHPLDCPICDQGGECELQDVALGYGKDVSRFCEGKRVVVDKDIGPLIHTDMTRCIHCTRCVRFGTEIAGIREMGATGRGEHMKIGTFIEKSIDSEVSGNIIDLCPVGALVAKPSRFQARAWELQQELAISPHDCIGSNLNIHSRRNQVIRVVPKENEEINEVWLSDRDRFSYEALNQAERLTKPKIKKDGQWQTVDWQTALEFAREGLQQVRSRHGAEQIGALASPNSSTEEFFLLQKLMRGLGCHNIDHRFRISDFSKQGDEPLFPSLGIKISELEELDACLLVAANLRKDQPIASLRLRKASGHAEIMAINTYDCHYNFRLTHDIQVDAGEILSELSGILCAVIEKTEESIPANVRSLFSDFKHSSHHEQIAEKLLAAEKGAIILGNSGIEHSKATHIKWLLQLIAEFSQVEFGQMSHGANSAGAYLAGAIPHRNVAGRGIEQAGKNAAEMLAQGMKSFILLNTEPALDGLNKKTTLNNLKKTEFVIALTPFADGKVLDYGDVLLPIAGFTETSGTYVNVEGKWQSFKAVVKAKGEARPAWKVLRVLGNLLQIKDFDYLSSLEVIEEVKRKVAAISAANVGHKLYFEALETGGEIPEPINLYKVDPLVRRAISLQQTRDANLIDLLKIDENIPAAKPVGGMTG